MVEDGSRGAEGEKECYHYFIVLGKIDMYVMSIYNEIENRMNFHLCCNDPLYSPLRYGAQFHNFTFIVNDIFFYMPNRDKPLPRLQLIFFTT